MRDHLAKKKREGKKTSRTDIKEKKEREREIHECREHKDRMLMNIYIYIHIYIHTIQLNVSTRFINLKEYTSRKDTLSDYNRL